MNHEDFTTKLISRFPSLDSKTNQLQDIKDNLRNVSEFALDDLWQAFQSYYDKDSVPRWASIYGCAVRAGIGIGTSRQIKYWVYVCQYCGSYFGGHSREVQKCTGCKKFKPASCLVLDRDDNPFNLNQKKFGDPAGNTNPVEPIEPHVLSNDWPKWVKDHPKPEEARPVQQEHVIF